MPSPNRERGNFSRSMIVVLAGVVLASLVFHGIFFDHHHPEPIFAVGVFAICHADAKKLFTILLLAFAAVWCAWRCMMGGVIFKGRWLRRTEMTTIWEEPHPTTRMFSQGILHPKLCA